MEISENGSHTTFVASARSRKRCRGELYLSQNKFQTFVALWLDIMMSYFDIYVGNAQMINPNYEFKRYIHGSHDIPEFEKKHLCIPKMLANTKKCL